MGNATFNSFASFTLAVGAAGYMSHCGGSTYHGDVVFNNESSHHLTTESLSGPGSTYHGRVFINKTGTGPINLAAVGSNTQFNDDIIISSTNIGQITICGFPSSSATLANGKKFLVGSGGVTAGTVIINRITQTGTTTQNFTYTGNASLQLNTGNSFGGNVTVSLAGTGMLTVGANNTFHGKNHFSAPQVILNGSTFHDSTTVIKTGATNNSSSGGNKFLGFALLTNTGSGSMAMGTTSADTFLQKTILRNSGSSTLVIANNHTNRTSYFGDTVIIENTSTAGAGNPGIRFCENNNTHVNFNGVVIATNGGTGATNLIRFQNGSGQTVFNRRAHFNNNCTGANSVIRVSQNGHTTFKDNAYCSATGGIGVSFGNGTGTSLFESTYRILLGDAGYNANQLQINRVRQLGSRAPVTITLSGNTLLTISNSRFGEEYEFSAPQVVVNNDTFDKVVRITKTGMTNNISSGGNVFNDSTVITNASSASLILASTNPDIYNSHVRFVRSGSGALDPASNATITFRGNVETGGSGAIAFNTGGANGRIRLMGPGVQYIRGNSSLPPSIVRMEVNKNAAQPVVLQVPVNIAANGSLTLTSGRIKTDSVNVLTLMNNATSNIGNDSSYVDGYLNYQMAAATTRTLVFPIGRDSVYRPVQLTVNHNATTNYTYSALLRNESARALNRTLGDGISLVSDMRYWQIERLLTSTMVKSNANLAGNQTITLYYDYTDYVTDAPNLRIVKNTPAEPNKWINIGGVGSANGKGFITSTSDPSAFNTFSDFTLGNFGGGGNPLPVTLVDLKATAMEKAIEVEWTTGAEINNKGFEVQRSEDGLHFTAIGWVDGNGTSNEHHRYVWEDREVIPNVLYYYRLKQIDFDEQFEITKMVSAQLREDSKDIIHWATISSRNNGNPQLLLEANERGLIEITTFNTMGAVIQNEIQSVTNGLNQFEIGFKEALQSGVYITSIKMKNSYKTIKWILAR